MKSYPANSYPAEMFRAGSGARAVRGTLEVRADALVFTTEGDTLELPLSGLICRLSGYDNRTFFFAHPNEEGAEIAVKAPEVRHDPVLQALPIFSEAQRVGRATHLRFWGCIALLGLGALTILATVAVVATLFLRWLLAP